MPRSVIMVGLSGAVQALYQAEEPLRLGEKGVKGCSLPEWAHHPRGTPAPAKEAVT